MKEAKNVTYSSFVEPAQTLVVTAEIVKQEERLTTVKAHGKVGGVTTVKARLILERYNLADEDPARKLTDEVVVRKLQELFALLWRPEPATA